MCKIKKFIAVPNFHGRVKKKSGLLGGSPDSYLVLRGLLCPHNALPFTAGRCCV